MKDRDIDEALAAIEAERTFACPARTTEYDGSPAECMLGLGHTDTHTDGCIGWFDGFRELDTDTHAQYLKDKEERKQRRRNKP